MGQTMTEKILAKHLVVGTLHEDVQTETGPAKRYKAGGEIGIRIDQTLTQDATGTMAYLQFEAMGLDKVKTDLSVSYVDHNTIQVGFENADDHKYLQSVAAKYGIVYSRAGNGICHQVHLERFGKPGTTLLGSDSHTPTGGGVGQIAIGAGGLDVALAMAGEPFYLTAPKVYKIELKGRLKPWVSAKDVVLEMLKRFSTKGNVGVIMEYSGPGVKNLSVPERATITNMGAEMGVTTSIFPSDEVTKEFLESQGRGQDWVPLEADPDAVYDKVEKLNLAKVVPMAAAPHSPGNVVTVESLKGMKVDQVLVGSCTNSSYKDLMTVAKVMKGRKVHPDVSFGVAPGSRQVIQAIADQGGLKDLVDSGARILESACGFCIGNHQSPKSKGVSLRTSNRNFEGRSGTKDAQVYLVSPEVAAIAAITGEIVDPRTAGIPYQRIRSLKKSYVDDSMFIFPKDAKQGDIFRGPNIGEPPKNDGMPEAIRGQVTLKVGDKITTDHIMPAGARLKYRSNVPKYAEFVFEGVDATFSKRAMENKGRGVHNVIVGGQSYGQGSSREHAALCPMYLGVKAVIAQSFERIHSANLINFGILPLTFEKVEDYQRVEQGDELEIPDLHAALKEGKPLMVRDKTKVFEFKVLYDLSDRQKAILLAGGTLAYIKNK